jgi:CDP-paratose 2-epimerase
LIFRVRILITGGAGFVGSNLAMALRKEFPAAEIVCMDNLYRRGSELNVPRLEKVGVNPPRHPKKSATIN